MRARWSFALLPIFVLLLPARIVPQGPPPPAKLVIYSEPAGASVTINGQRMQQRTNATFNVSAGKYVVSVTNSSSGSPLTCSSPSGEPVSTPPGAVQVNVSSGQTAAITCK
jgi:hypothetical protein